MQKELEALKQEEADMENADVNKRHRLRACGRAQDPDGTAGAGIARQAG